MSGGIQTLHDGPLLVVRFDRAEKMNAITDGMYGALVEALRAAEADAGVQAVVMTGADHVFTAGNDVGDFIAGIEMGKQPEAWNAAHFVKMLARFRKPLVAAVRGPAVGVGTTLLLHCDLVVLGESARLSVPFANLGLPPEAASSRLLPTRIGHARAFEMFALGSSIDARTAYEWGLANRLVADADVLTTAIDLAKALAKRPAAALAATKMLMRDGDAIEALIDAELDLFFRALAQPEAQAAFRRFLDQRR